MSEDSKRRAGLWLKRGLPLLAIAVAAALVYAQGWHQLLTVETLSDNRDALKTAIAENFVGALGAYVLVYVAVVALSVPGAIYLTLAGGFLFGWPVGGLATVMAATAGATIIFLIAKTSLGEPLAARAGPRLARLRAGFQENALSYLLFLRLVPLFPFWLVNLAPGLLGVPLRTYVLATFVGIVPGTFAIAFVGVGLDSVIVAQRRAYEACLARHADGAAQACELSLEAGALITPELLIAFAALGLLALLPVAVKRLRKNAKAP